MKRSFISIVVALLAFVTIDCFAQKTDTKKDYPYKADYSSDFKLGSDAYARIILNMWQDWDDNNFERHDYMADTVVLLFPDGSMIKGKKEALEGAKKYRGAMTSAKSIIHAWLPLHSNDKGEDMVCVWGQETDVFPDGKTEVRDLHEVWWFNKDGKVTMLRQWAAKFAPMQ